jgi:hypothetical protein
MMGRNRRYGKGRRADLKTRLGIATAVLVGGGAIGVAAVATSSHSTPTASKAGYYSSSTPTSSYGWYGGSKISTALSSWSWNQSRSLSLLAQLQLRAERQQWFHRTMFAAQRGVLVLLTPKFAIVKSNNGTLGLWFLSGNTVVRNASSSMPMASALTGSTTLAQQILASQMMSPTTFMAGTPSTAVSLLNPAVTASTVAVHVANTNITVTVVVTNTTATVRTTNSFLTSAVLFRQSAFFTMNTLKRGDLVLFAGTRTANVLRANLVLFAPLTSSDFTGTSSTGSSVGGNSSTGFSGSHT